MDFLASKDLSGCKIPHVIRLPWVSGNNENYVIRELRKKLGFRMEESV